jgi:uncharacterized protein (DUF1800 family)
MGSDFMKRNSDPSAVRPADVVKFGTILAATLFSILGAHASEKSTVPTTRQQAVHALNRLAFGPASGDVDRVVNVGWRAWVEQQLDPKSIDDSSLERRLRKFPSLEMSMAQTYRSYRPPRALVPETSREQRKLELEKQRLRRGLQRELDESVFLRAAESRRQFNEVIVNFWRNHLNIDCNKSPYWANHYEVNVLRKHAFGMWEDLLMASAKHPAMLVYLDNYHSKKGNINENYARELMELHTLGVDNCYTQQDVGELTRVLTGWTCFWRYDDDGTEHWRFIFRANHHDSDPATVLGLRLDGNGGLTDGEMAVRYLAHHEGTARFLARKLCRHLVSDDPPEALVDHVAAVFRATRGDLTKVYRAIILSPEFMDPVFYGSKHKTPFEFVISAVRATGACVENPRRTLQALEVMGQPVFKCGVPTGYSDQAEAWLDPGALVHRWNFAMRFANDKEDGVAIPATFHERMAGSPPVEMRRQTIDAILPGGPGTDLAKSLSKTGDPRRMIALALGSPAFQQQ